MTHDFIDAVKQCLQCDNPQQKTQCVLSLWKAYQQNDVIVENRQPVDATTIRGTPPGIQLVAAKKLPKRGLKTVEGRAAMMHAMAHIEYNAIDLALDAVYRFHDCPVDYYKDWLAVAADESQHFLMVRDYLKELGFEYGDFPAHDGLWRMACKTSHDVLVRMAIIPRVMEARGLDASVAITEKFAACGDPLAVKILETIFHDEIRHVATGTRWFHYFCDQRRLPREATFRELLTEYFGPTVKLPLHRQARLQAGFTHGELDFLESMVKS